jgi:hypothetical protein
MMMVPLLQLRKGTVEIAHVLKTNVHIEELDLRGNNIRGDGATALAQALRINKSLKTYLHTST